MGIAPDDDPLPLLKSQFVVVHRGGVGMTIDYGIEGQFFRGLGGVVGGMNLLRHGANRKGARSGEAETGACGHLVDTGWDPGCDGDPVAQGLMASRVKLGGFYRDLLAFYPRMGKEEFPRFLQLAAANGDLRGLARLRALGKDCLQVRLGKLGLREERPAKGQSERSARPRSLLS